MVQRALRRAERCRRPGRERAANHYNIASYYNDAYASGAIDADADGSEDRGGRHAGYVGLE